MAKLIDIIKDAERRNVAVGHFNTSDLVALKGILAAASDLNVPIIIGLSEGEREFIGVKTAAALIKAYREQYDFPVFLNADHTYSLDKIKEAVEAGFDAVIFDGAKLTLEENIARTREAVNYVRSVKPDVIVEGELGYIGTSSEVLDKIPAGVALDENLTKPEDAARFVQETGVDLLAPAVGNIHGMFKNIPEPHLNIGRIKKIRAVAGVPLVLHGGSGISDEDFSAAITAGISVIHINTELRVAWRNGIEQALRENLEEVAPYKLLEAAYQDIYNVVAARLRLFNRLPAGQGERGYCNSV
jgi:fructose-bisphosphate aldolase class II